MSKQKSTNTRVFIGLIILTIAITMSYFAFKSPESENVDTPKSVVVNSQTPLFMDSLSNELSTKALFGWKGTYMGSANSFLFNENNVWVFKIVTKDLVYDDTVSVEKTSKGWQIKNDVTTYLINKNGELEAYEDGGLIATYKPFK